MKFVLRDICLKAAVFASLALLTLFSAQTVVRAETLSGTENSKNSSKQGSVVWGKGFVIEPIIRAQTTQLRYGAKYHIQNGYGNWRGGYLDTRATGCDDNLFCVSTSSSRNRDRGSGIWQLLGPGKGAGQPVMDGDVIFLKNEYQGNAGYLDTRGGGCQDNYLCVSTANTPRRDQGSGGWKIQSNTGQDKSEIYDREAVQLINQYQRKGGYLDTRGVGCNSNQLCVSTHSKQYRDGESTIWRFIQAQ